MAVDVLVQRIRRAVRDTGLPLVVVGGGVAANRYLRETLSQMPEIRSVFPPMELCTDNAAMVAGIAYRLLKDGYRALLDARAEPRVPLYRKAYP